MKKVFQALVSLAVTAPAFCANLEVNITPTNNDKGYVLVAIYDSSDSWLEAEKILKKSKQKANKKSSQFKFDLPPGTYGVSVIHDENDNSKMDMQWLPPSPEEGYGISNNKDSFGKPDWDDAKLDLKADRKIEIILNYPD